MELVVRTLQNKEVKVTVNQDEDTVDGLREKVASAFNQDDPSKVVLLCHGKMLSGGPEKLATVEPRLQNGDKIIFMPFKSSKKDSQKPTSTASPAIVAPAATGAAAPATSTNVVGEVPSAASVAPVEGTAVASPVAGNIPDSSAFDSTVETICAMGFQREDVKRAVELAGNNAEQAVEILTSGLRIPPDAEGSARRPPQTADTTVALLASFFRTWPSFQEIRRAAMADPASLTTLIQLIQQHNPELAQLIMQNQAEFLRALIESEEEGDDIPALADGANAGAEHVHTVVLSPDEREAVNRLMDLGFSESAAIQAYLACEKNEEAAANLLFDHIEEFDGD